MRKYLYVRNDWKRRYITIVSEVFTEGEKSLVKFAWTFCHNKDKFIKKEGKKLVDERFDEMTPGYSGVAEVAELNFHRISYVILGHIFNAENTPFKYLDDIQDDMFYYLQFSNGKPSFASIFNKVDRMVSYETKND